MRPTKPLKPRLNLVDSAGDSPKRCIQVLSNQAKLFLYYSLVRNSAWCTVTQHQLLLQVHQSEYDLNCLRLRRSICFCSIFLRLRSSSSSLLFWKKNAAYLARNLFNSISCFSLFISNCSTSYSNLPSFELSSSDCSHSLFFSVMFI